MTSLTTINRLSYFTSLHSNLVKNRGIIMSIIDIGIIQILIIWNWDGQYLNRRYCKDRMTTHRYGEYEAWRIAFNAAAQIMGVVESEK